MCTFKFEKCPSTGPLSRLTFSSQETEDKGRKSSTPGDRKLVAVPGEPHLPAPQLGHDGGSFLCPSYETLLAFLWSQRWTERGRTAEWPPTAADRQGHETPAKELRQRTRASQRSKGPHREQRRRTWLMPFPPPLAHLPNAQTDCPCELPTDTSEGTRFETVGH